MRTVRRGLRLAAVVLPLCAAAASGDAWTLELSDGFRLGEGEGWTNTTSVEIGWRGWTGQAWFGEAEFDLPEYVGPLPELSFSWGGGLRREITDVVWVAGRYGWYDGAAGLPPSPSTSYECGLPRTATPFAAGSSWFPGRVESLDQATEGGSGEMGLLLHRSPVGEQGGEFSARLSLGGTALKHSFPGCSVETGSMDETIYHGRLSLGLFGTTLQVAHRRHRYQGHGDARKKEVRGVLERTDSGPWGVFRGLPGQDYSLFLEEYVGNGTTLMGRGSYVQMHSPEGLGRVFSAEAAKVLWGRVRAKAGCLWVREAGSTERCATLGISVRF